ILRHQTQRFYLHHFIRSTASIYFPLQSEEFLRFVLTIGESSACMLGAVLVASCHHHVRLKGDENSEFAATEATVQTLSSLQTAISAPRSQSGTLATSLMLATTCLCTGDTVTYRQHLEGARMFAQEVGALSTTDELWSFDIKWLAHLLLMDQVSSSPNTFSWRKRPINWVQLAQAMPSPGEIDPTTYLSFDLITIIDEICDCSHLPVDSIAEERAQILECRLSDLRSQVSHETQVQSQLVLVHLLYSDAALLTLYIRLLGLDRNDLRVVSILASMQSTLSKIDKYSTANIPLLWPLLVGGCEARSDAERQTFAGRMAAMATHGVGNCNIVLSFMRKY
ncbi:fungal-specific transcription factor domain-containing protein, partial [Microdochium trichocladiopsis]